jgi:hypothetical protein
MDTEDKAPSSLRSAVAFQVVIRCRAVHPRRGAGHDEL